jgi:DNA-binding NtrC family response regulator
MSPPERGRIGVVEDDPVLGGTLVQRLELEGYAPVWWQTGHEALKSLSMTRPDLVVCDIRLPDMSGEDVYLQTVPALGATPFLFVTAFGEIEQAVRLAKAGAIDYIVKPYDLPALLEQIEQLIAVQPRAGGTLGSSEAMCRVETLLRRVANLDSSLLFTGESGVGKEVAAHFVHENSTRVNEPFVAVNCAAIPSELLESQLFGHEKGAFTGATQQRLGRFELANGGTLFLDEVGELPAETQIALLRVLQEHEFERVGGTRRIHADVRVIAATNRDLQAAISGGSFRSDLFYRLNVFPIETPSLRERRADIPLLVEYFIDRYARKAGKNIKRVNKKTLELLQSYPWPGNIRELQNVIERSVILCETEIFSIDENWLPQPPPLTPESKQQVELPRRLLVQEKDMIEAALKESRGRVFGPYGAAGKLGIPRSTLESKIKSLKIDKNRFRTSPET